MNLTAENSNTGEITPSVDEVKYLISHEYNINRATLINLANSDIHLVQLIS